MKKLKNLYWDLLDFLEDHGYNRFKFAFIGVNVLIVLLVLLALQ